MRVVYEGPCHRWTYEQFAWYEPLELCVSCFTSTTDRLLCVVG